MRVLVTGANGFLGSHIADSLAAAGHEARLLVRATSRLDFLSGAEYERALGDVRDVDSLRRAMAGVDAVIHSAGLTTALREADYVAVNVDGTAAAVAAAAEAGVSRFVYVSSLAAQGPSPDARPRSPDEVEPSPTSAYGRSKLAGEEKALAYAGRLHVTVVRPPVIYGPRDRALLPVFRLVKFRLMPLFGAGRNLLSWIHVKDAAEALVAAEAAATPSGRVYTISDGGIYTWRDLGAAAGAAVGHRPLMLPIPHALYAAAGYSVGAISLAIRKPLPLNPVRVREMAQPAWICGHEGFSHDTGWQPQIALAEGMAGTVAWYRANGWL